MIQDTKEKVALHDLHELAESYKVRQNEKHAQFEQGTKFDSGKPLLDLLDPYALEELAKVLTFGAGKYAPHNWRKGIAISRLTASLLRHIFAFMRGQNTDPETGLSHIAHAMCNCMFILWTMEYKPGFDDRPPERPEGNPEPVNCTKTD
mgnify:CR=1 FL=1